MNPTYQNPYNFTRPINESGSFAGRMKEIKEIEYCLDLSMNQRPIYMSLALIGERASGKTSLLNQCVHLASQKDFLAVKTNLDNQVVTDELSFFYEVYNGIMTLGCTKGMYGGIDQRKYGTFRQVIDLHKTDIEMAHMPLLFPFSYVGSREHPERTFSVSQHVLVNDFKELYREAKKVGLSTIVLLFDECDLFSLNEALLQKLRNLFSEVDGYVLIFAGTDSMFAKLQAVFSPIPRQFKKIPVENFKSKHEVQECVFKPLRPDEKQLITFETIEDLFSLTGGSPYEIQLVCYIMYTRYELQKTDKLEITKEVLDDIKDELDRLRKRESKTSVATIMQELSEAQLNFLSHFVPYVRLHIDQIIDLHRITHILKPDTKETVPLNRQQVLQRLRSFQTKGLIKIDSDTISFWGDSFDKLYIKYHIRARYEKIEWMWNENSFTELIAHEVSDHIAENLSKFFHSIIVDPIVKSNKHSATDFYWDLVSVPWHKLQLDSNSETAPISRTLTTKIVPPMIYISEMIKHTSLTSYTRKILSCTIEINHLKERTTGYYLFFLEPDVIPQEAIEALESHVDSCSSKIEHLGIKLNAKEVQHFDDPDVLTTQLFKELVITADDSDIRFLRMHTRSTGIAEYLSHNPKEALEVFKFSLDLWPTWGEASNNIGFVLLDEESKYDAAEFHLLNALENDLNSPEVTHLNLSYLYFRRNHYQKSLEHLLIAKDLSRETFPEKTAWLRLNYFPKEFAQVLDNPSKKNVYSIDKVIAIYVNMCAVFLAQDKLDEALMICEQGLKVNSQDKFMLLAKASAYFTKNQLTQALEATKKAGLSKSEDSDIREITTTINNKLKKRK